MRWNMYSTCSAPQITPNRVQNADQHTYPDPDIDKTRAYAIVLYHANTCRPMALVITSQWPWLLKTLWPNETSLLSAYQSLGGFFPYCIPILLMYSFIHCIPWRLVIYLHGKLRFLPFLIPIQFYVQQQRKSLLHFKDTFMNVWHRVVKTYKISCTVVKALKN